MIRKPTKNNNHKPYWNEELTRSWKNISEAERLYKRCQNHSVKPCLRTDFLNKRLFFAKLLSHAECKYNRGIADTLPMTLWLVKLVGLVAMLATSWQHYVSGIVSLIYRHTELPLEFLWDLSQCDKVSSWSCNTQNIFINLDMLEQFDSIEYCDLQICYEKMKFNESEKWNVRRTSKTQVEIL